MGLKLLIGGAGSGKTHRCIQLLQSYLEAGKWGEAVFLLPNEEQVDELKEVLLRRSGRPGFFDPPVFTFAGLSRRVVSRAMRPERVVPDVWRAAALREIAHADPSGFYRQARRVEGFSRHLGDLIREFKHSLISPDDLLPARAAVARERGSIHGELEEKLSELASLYRGYDAWFQARGQEDREDMLWRASRALEADGTLLAPAALVLVDGFSNFTPCQLSLLRALSRAVGEVVVTLCYERGRGELFSPTERMYELLRRWEPCSEEWLETNHRAGNASLLHLERGLFSRDLKPRATGGNVVFLEGYGRYNEAELVAQEIRRLVREESYGYEEIGVILRSLDSYREIFPRMLSLYEIPYYMVQSIPLEKTPVARTLLAALDVAEGDWSGERVMDVMKGIYACSDAEAADLVENYALAHGLSGRDDWLRPLEKLPASQDMALRAARFKEGLIERLLTLERRVRDAEDFDAAAGAIRDELGFLAESLVKAGASDLAELHRQSLRALFGLLGDVAAFSPAQSQRSPWGSEVIGRVREAISTSRVRVAQGEERGVRVTDVYAARVPDYRAVFVVGLLEGAFPSRPPRCPFLSDGERALLRSRAGLPLEDRAQAARDEPYLFYVALTRASEKVYLSYPLVDESGAVQDVSHFVDEVRGLFVEGGQGIPARRGSSMRPLPALERVETRRQLADALVAALWQPVPPSETAHLRWGLATALWNRLRAHLSRQERALLAGEDLPRQGANLNHPIVLAKVRQRAEVFSPTSLERYANCPFAYFCEYMLRLEERPVLELTALEEGAIYHAVLRSLYAATRERGVRRLSDLGRDELLGLVRMLLRNVVSGGYSRYFNSRRMVARQRSMEEVLERFIIAEAEAQRASALVPAMFELSFGGKGPEEPCDPRSTSRFLEIPIAGGSPALLRGRIDRVDLLEDDGRLAGVVVDYKRKRSDPVLGRIQQGLDLQLGAYLLALRDLFGVGPIGGFYYSISEARKRGVFVKDKEMLLAQAGTLARRDALSAEELARLLAEVQLHVGRYVEGVLAGEIPISPDECKWCAYRSVCRTDPVQAMASRGTDE